MARNSKCQPVNRLAIFTYLLINVVLIRSAFINGESWYWIPLLALPLILFFKPSINQKFMSNNLMNPVVLPESDVQILKRLAASQVKNPDDMSLAHEVERAIIVKDHAFPQNTIRINSRVEIQNLDTEEVSVFSLVLPEHADIKKKKISILAPMGAALIGFREGDIVSWKMPRGIKHLKVLSVYNTTLS